MIVVGVLVIVALIMVSGCVLGVTHDDIPILSVIFAIVITLIGGVGLCGMIDDIEKANFDLALKCAENGIECVVIDIDTFEERLSKEAVLRAKAGESIDIKSVLSFVSEKDSN
ncbi:MAG TPA: hypothetical protein DE117_06700 [Fervidobacterium sp.]|nr:hypothetical protein [Fervidobacterium sp.]